MTRIRSLRIESLEIRNLLASVPIDTLDRDAVIVAYSSQFKPFIDVPVQWDGNTNGCVAGAVSAQTTDATLNVLNFLRNMAGVQGVELDPTFNSKAQQAALMMHAQNSLSHSPGTNWACYSVAGAQGAGASNLFLGVTGPSAMVGYVEDWGDSNYSVGHRRWLLNPNTDRMGIGSTSTANALYVFGPRVNPPAPDWISWPPQGYVPKELVFPRWSLSRSGADFSAATVQMTVHGQSVPVNLEPVVNGYAQNTLVWEPSITLDMVSAEEFIVDVLVENVIVNGVSTSFRYTVTPIQPGTPVQTIAAAQDDRVEMRAGQSNFFFNVLANDNVSHPDWAPATTSSLAVSVVGGPKNGRVARALGNPGIFFYYPNPGFVGVDTFSYRIADLDAGRVSNLATVQVTVSDGSLPTNLPPTISTISDQSATSGNTTEAVSFLIGDPDTNLADLILTATSANQTLVPHQNVAFAGSGANRTLTVTPVAGQTGTDTITIWVSDGQNTAFESFVVSVTPSENSKSDPVITWSDPEPIVFGTAISAAQLNATANVAGNFQYSPAIGTILNVGAAQQLSVTFTPTDTSNYHSVTKSVTVDVIESGGGGIFPIGSVNYTAFDGKTVQLLHYEGRNLALLVPRDDLDPEVMQRLLGTLDDAYDYYHEATGRRPATLPATTINGRATIAVVPHDCGAACAYLGFNGIEIQPTYFEILYDGVRLENYYDQVLFYELGRNFWFYNSSLAYKQPDDGWSVITGYAVLMRFLSMDAAGAEIGPFRGRSGAEFRDEVEGLVDRYLADSSLNWGNTLRIGNAPANPMNLGSTDLFASFVMRLQRDYGSTDFIGRLWREAADRPAATTSQDAVDNFIVAASRAAGTNLANLFDDWRWPLSMNARDELDALPVLQPVLNDRLTGTYWGRSLMIDLMQQVSSSHAAIDAGSVLIVSEPAHGSVALLGDGRIHYDAEAGFVGEDAIEVTVRDVDGRVSNRAMVIIRVVASPAQNPLVMGDVNDDGDVHPLDALLVLVRLARAGREGVVGGLLAAAVADEMPLHYYDVDGNGRIEPLDALIVLTEIARKNRGGSPEGESGIDQPSAVPTIVIAPPFASEDRNDNESPNDITSLALPGDWSREGTAKFASFDWAEDEGSVIAPAVADSRDMQRDDADDERELADAVWEQYWPW